MLFNEICPIVEICIISKFWNNSGYSKINWTSLKLKKIIKVAEVKIVEDQCVKSEKSLINFSILVRNIFDR